MKSSLKRPSLSFDSRQSLAAGTTTPSMSTPRASDFASRRLLEKNPSLCTTERPDGYGDSYPENTRNIDSSQNMPGSSVEIDPLVLPYGHSSPVIHVLNQPPFADFIRGLLRSVCSNEVTETHLQSGTLQDQEASYRPVDVVTPFAFSTGLPQPPAPKAKPLTRLPHTEPPNVSHLASCVEKYTVHVQALYHIMPPQRLDKIVTSFLRRSEALDDQLDRDPTHSTVPTQTQVELAIEYLVFALGGLCWAKWDNTIFESGPVFSDRATCILRQLSEGLLLEESKNNIDLEGPAANFHARSTTVLAHQSDSKPENDASFPTEQSESRGMGPLKMPTNTSSVSVRPLTTAPLLDLARAYLLAAISCGQLAKMQEAADHVYHASSIIHHLIREPSKNEDWASGQSFCGPSLVEYQQHPHLLSEDEQQLVSLYWSCVQLE